MKPIYFIIILQLIKFAIINAAGGPDRPSGSGRKRPSEQVGQSAAGDSSSSSDEDIRDPRVVRPQQRRLQLGSISQQMSQNVPGSSNIPQQHGQIRSLTQNDPNYPQMAHEIASRSFSGVMVPSALQQGRPRFGSGSISRQLSQNFAASSPRLSGFDVTPSEIARFLDEPSSPSSSVAQGVRPNRTSQALPLVSQVIRPTAAAAQSSATASAAAGGSSAPLAAAAGVQQNVRPAVQQDRCMICLDDLNSQNYVRLNCGHHWHQTCLTASLTQTGPFCPLCRSRNVGINNRYAGTMAGSQTQAAPASDLVGDTIGAAGRRTSQLGQQSISQQYFQPTSVLMGDAIRAGRRTSRSSFMGDGYRGFLHQSISQQNFQPRATQTGQAAQGTMSVRPSTFARDGATHQSASHGAGRSGLPPMQSLSRAIAAQPSPSSLGTQQNIPPNAGGSSRTRPSSSSSTGVVPLSPSLPATIQQQSSLEQYVQQTHRGAGGSVTRPSTFTQHAPSQSATGSQHYGQGTYGGVAGRGTIRPSSSSTGIAPLPPSLSDRIQQQSNQTMQQEPSTSDTQPHDPPGNSSPDPDHH